MLALGNLVVGLVYAAAYIFNPSVSSSLGVILLSAWTGGMGMIGLGALME